MISLGTAGNLAVEYFVAFNIRFWLFNSEFRETIAGRVEVSTPVNSWKRVTEGVTLQNAGIDPYCGDIFHETPLGLMVFTYMIQAMTPYLPLIFIFLDLLTGHLLYLTAVEYMKFLVKLEGSEKKGYHPGVEDLLVTQKHVERQPLYVAAAYLFNPYIIANTVGQTTTVFSNLFLAVFFLSMIKGNRLGACASLAIATYQSLYPVVLIVPASICIGYYTLKTSDGHAAAKKSDVLQKILPRGLRSQYSSHWISSMALTFLTFASLLSVLLIISANIGNGWSYLKSVYGFVLMVPDLRPNIGLFWYFFTEMFEHFRVLYLYAFQLNAFVLYLVPLSLRTRKDPMLLAYYLIAITAMFKSYPSLGDVGFYLSLLPMWAHIFPYFYQGFVVMVALLITSVLGPTVWHLWIYVRSANANFYFGVTLSFAIAQIFLLTDLILSHSKREFELWNGTKRALNGKPAKMVLL